MPRNRTCSHVHNIKNKVSTKPGTWEILLKSYNLPCCVFSLRFSKLPASCWLSKLLCYNAQFCNATLQLKIAANNTYPHHPSPCSILGKPSRNVVANPGWVCMRTLRASIGHKAMSAKNSAEALAARYSDVLHIYAFSYVATCHTNTFTVSATKSII